MITLVVGLSVAVLGLVLVLALVVGPRVVRRRHAARAAASENTPLRCAARKPPELRIVENPVMHWVPDEHGGLRLAGRYLPVTGETASASAPRRRRRGR